MDINGISELRLKEGEGLHFASPVEIRMVRDHSREGPHRQPPRGAVRVRLECSELTGNDVDNGVG